MVSCICLSLGLRNIDSHTPIFIKLTEFISHHLILQTYHVLFMYVTVADLWEQLYEYCSFESSFVHDLLQ